MREPEAAPSPSRAATGHQPPDGAEAVDLSVVVTSELVLIRGTFTDAPARDRILGLLSAAFVGRRVRDLATVAESPPAESTESRDNADVASGGSGKADMHAPGARDFPRRPDAPGPRADGLPHGHPPR